MKLPTAPKGLSAESKRWWKKLLSEYEISDSGGRLLLEEMLRALDRLRGAQGILQAEGVVIEDRFGQKKTHPAVLVERDSRSQFLTALRNLNLDLEPLKAIGRPGGR